MNDLEEPASSTAVELQQRVPPVAGASPQADNDEGDDSDEIDKEISRLESLGTDDAYYDEEEDQDQDEVKAQTNQHQQLMTEDTIDVSIDQDLQEESEQPKASPSKSNKPDVVKQMQNQWERDSRPRNLGNLYCFMYDEKTGQPRIVIGPDYMFSGVEFGLANLITWGVALVPAILQKNNLAFVATVCQNPGLPPRSPLAHTKSYLYRVKSNEGHLFCHTCKIIARKDIDTEHCTYCNYCVEKLDHHCPWSSKCIASGNMLSFRVFIAMTVGLFVFVILAAMFLTATSMPFDGSS